MESERNMGLSSEFRPGSLRSLGFVPLGQRMPETISGAVSSAPFWSRHVRVGGQNLGELSYMKGVFFFRATMVDLTTL